MKHSYSITTAIALAIAIPLVLGTIGTINPPAAYAFLTGGDDGEKRIQLNLASASNTATQTNDCGNYSIVQDDSDVNCGNLAGQANLIGQSNSYTEQTSSQPGSTYVGGTDGGGGGGETNVQVNAAKATNTATQSNTCGNLSNVQDDSDVNCANAAFQLNEILQSNDITDTG